MGWLGGLVVGIFIGWIGQAWWTSQVETASAQRLPSPWLRRKDDNRLFRRDGRATERDGQVREMVVLYDCQASKAELWPQDEVERDFRVVERADAG
jgi:hypothetical protein